MTVIAIIVILIAMLLPLFGRFRAGAQKAACINNLKSLYVAANAYTQDQGHWPQVSTKLFGTPAFAEGWYDALSRYQIARINWICPTIQGDLGNPDISKPGAMRIDYIATPFGSDSRDAYKYPTQPWFVERGDVHGDGNMVIFTSGQILSLSQIRLMRPAQ